MFDPKESEGTKRRHQVDTVVEGMGINRVSQTIESSNYVCADYARSLRTLHWASTSSTTHTG